MVLGEHSCFSFFFPGGKSNKNTTIALVMKANIMTMIITPIVKTESNDDTTTLYNIYIYINLFLYLFSYWWQTSTDQTFHMYPGLFHAKQNPFFQPPFLESFESPPFFEGIRWRWLVTSQWRSWDDRHVVFSENLSTYPNPPFFGSVGRVKENLRHAWCIYFCCKVN